MQNQDLKPWYETEQLLVDAKTVHRQPPANLEFLSAYWKDIFSKIADQDEPAIRLLEGEDVEIDIDGVIWTSPTEFHLGHHEYSEERVARQRRVHWPSCHEWFTHPRVAVRGLDRWINQAIHGVKRESLPSGCRAVYFSDNRAQGNFYHWMVDALGRLLIAEPWLKESYLLLSAEQMRREYVLESLARLGFRKDHLIPIKKGVRYRASNLQVVTCSIFATGACSSEGVGLVQRRLSITKNKPGISLYLARKPSLGRAIANQDEFMDTLRRFGVEAIYAEDIPFDKLTELLGETKILIGVYSAALTHAIFLPGDSHVVELASNKFLTSTPTYWGNRYPSKFAGDYYYSLSTACGLNYHLIPCSQKNENDYVLNANIYVDIELLSQTLSKIM